jgi:hypothetical protein
MQWGMNKQVAAQLTRINHEPEANLLERPPPSDIGIKIGKALITWEVAGKMTLIRNAEHPYALEIL